MVAPCVMGFTCFAILLALLSDTIAQLDSQTSILVPTEHQQESVAQSSRRVASLEQAQAFAQWATGWWTDRSRDYSARHWGSVGSSDDLERPYGTAGVGTGRHLMSRHLSEDNPTPQPQGDAQVAEGQAQSQPSEDPVAFQPQQGEELLPVAAEWVAALLALAGEVQVDGQVLLTVVPHEVALNLEAYDVSANDAYQPDSNSRRRLRTETRRDSGIQDETPAHVGRGSLPVQGIGTKVIDQSAAAAAKGGSLVDDQHAAGKVLTWDGSQEEAPGSLVELFIARLGALGVRNALAVTSSREAEDKLNALGLPTVALPVVASSEQGVSSTEYLRLKTDALRTLLAAWYHVLYTDVDVMFINQPFAALTGDSDIEGASGDEQQGEKAAGYQNSIEDPAMGWGHVGYQVHHPYFDGGLVYARATEGSLRALRLVGREVERYSASEQVREAYNNILYSKHQSRTQFWATWEPHLSTWGGPSDQQWLKSEHQRRVWELVLNRVLTRQFAPVEDLMPDGTIAGTSWPPTQKPSVDLKTGIVEGATSSGLENLALLRRIVSSDVFLTSLKWSTYAWRGSGKLSRCPAAIHVNAHPDKLQRLLAAAYYCGRVDPHLRQISSGVQTASVARWVVLDELQPLVQQQQKVQGCVNAECSKLTLSDEDRKQGVVTRVV